MDTTILKRIRNLKIRQTNSLHSILLYGLAAAIAALLIGAYAKRRAGSLSSYENKGI